MSTDNRHTYYISLGSNTPAASENIAKAVGFIDGLLYGATFSHPYRTEPLGCKPVPDYTNAVARGCSLLDADALNQKLKDYEKSCGRTREDSQRGYVVIDLDIVIADGEIIRQRDYDAVHFQKGYCELSPMTTT